MTQMISETAWANVHAFSYFYVQYLIDRGHIESIDGCIDADAAEQVLQALTTPQGDERTLSMALYEPTVRLMEAVNRFLTHVMQYRDKFNTHERDYFETVVDPGVIIICDILREWLNRTDTHHEENQNYENNRAKGLNNNSQGK